MILWIVEGVGVCLSYGIIFFTGPDLQLWGPLSVTTNLGNHNSSFLVLCFIMTSRYFREANVSVKSVKSISVLWRPRWGRGPTSTRKLIAIGGISRTVNRRNACRGLGGVDFEKLQILCGQSCIAFLSVWWWFALWNSGFLLLRDILRTMFPISHTALLEFSTPPLTAFYFFGVTFATCLWLRLALSFHSCKVATVPSDRKVPSSYSLYGYVWGNREEYRVVCFLNWKCFYHGHMNIPCSSSLLKTTEVASLSALLYE
jgi:hypothetical protein